MSSTLKKIERRKVLASRRDAQNALRQAERTLSNMKKLCVKCSTQFDPRAEGALDKWHIRVADEKAELTCPECWASDGVHETN